MFFLHIKNEKTFKKQQDQYQLLLRTASGAMSIIIVRM